MNVGSEFLEYSLIGLLSGGVLALIGLSFVLIYKGSHVINFAAGEIMMLGAYLYYTARVVVGLPLAAAIAVALGCVALVALVIERFVLRPLAGEPVISVLMATIGISSLLHGLVEAGWGGESLVAPQILPRAPFTFGDVLIPGTSVWNFAVAAALVAAFTAFFRFSRTGVTLRAAASDPVTACTLGINIRAAQRLTWILSGTVGTVAGILIASTSGLSPLLSSAALSVFAVIILGGLDSVLGAVVAALLIGWLDSLVVGYVGGKTRDLIPYVVVLAVLVVRPYGLFGTRTIERL